MAKPLPLVLHLYKSACSLGSPMASKVLTQRLKRGKEHPERLAERLGHRFEAILFLTAAIAEEPDRAELREDLDRLKKAAREPEVRSRGLVEMLPEDCDGDRRGS